MYNIYVPVTFFCFCKISIKYLSSSNIQCTLNDLNIYFRRSFLSLRSISLNSYTKKQTLHRYNLARGACKNMMTFNAKTRKTLQSLEV